MKVTNAFENVFLQHARNIDKIDRVAVMSVSEIELLSAGRLWFLVWEQVKFIWVQLM